MIVAPQSGHCPLTHQTCPSGASTPDYQAGKMAMILHSVSEGDWPGYQAMAADDGYGFFYATSASYNVLPPYLAEMMEAGDTGSEAPAAVESIVEGSPAPAATVQPSAPARTVEQPDTE